MLKQKVLGKGLGNLIPGNNSKSISESHSNSSTGNLPFLEIKISEIKMNPNQPRKTFALDSISELADTIKSHGLIQPIVVKKLSEGYELVSGERRLRACKEAGYIKIPAIIKNYSETESMQAALLENIQREDLNPIEEALAYQTLMEKLSIKITDLAQKVGKNRSTISNLVRLLQLPDSVKDLIKNGKLTEGQTRPLLSLGDKRKIESLANLIVEKGLSAREVEDQVAKLVDPGTRPAKKKSSQDPSVLNLENKLRNKVSAKTQIIHNNKSGKGKITIHYNNLDEMERIFENLGIKI